MKAAYNNPLARLKIKKLHPITIRREKKPLSSTRSAEKVIAIGVSTGGPNALSYLLPQLPKDFPAGILVVQHMPVGFTKMFAARLNAICEIEVKEASDGDLVRPGRALIAPGNRHLKVKRMPLGTITILSNSTPVNGHRPSADVLFHSVASEFGSSATGLIMTGMGNDGSLGIGEIKEKGGLTIAQNENSCVVFGMPKVAIEKNYIRKIISLEEMGNFLIDHFGMEQANHVGVKKYTPHP